MNDCSNADIRDRLPDLLHEHLDAASRAMVVAHVAECVDCRDELEVLRGVYETLNARTPRVDIMYVVNALPKPPAQRPQIAQVPLPRRRWSDWRIAAAVTVLVAGGSSLAVLRRTPATTGARPPITDSSLMHATVPSAVASGTHAQSAPAAAPSASETIAQVDEPDTAGDDGPDGRFGGLNDAQMETLLNEIDQLKPIPVAEPEPVTIRVDLRPSGPEGTP